MSAVDWQTENETETESSAPNGARRERSNTLSLTAKRISTSDLSPLCLAHRVFMLLFTAHLDSWVMSMFFQATLNEWRTTSIIKAPVSILFKVRENSGAYDVSNQCLYCVHYRHFCVSRDHHVPGKPGFRLKQSDSSARRGGQWACQCDLHALPGRLIE